MRITIEYLEGGLLRVSTGAEQHTVLEAHCRFDGAMPVLDLTHVLGEVECVGKDVDPEAPKGRYLDGTPIR